MIVAEFMRMGFLLTASVSRTQVCIQVQDYSSHSFNVSQVI